MRRTGHFNDGLIIILASMGKCSLSDWRVMEMAFITKETLPASMAWLLDGGVQVNTSGVSDSWYSAFMYLSASTVFLELMATLPCSSCSAPPNDHNMARMAMLVLSSCANPRPQGWPDLSRIFLAPARRSS